MANQIKIYRREGVIPPLDISPNIRDEDSFYHLLMFFHHPANWPAWMVAVSLIFLAGLTGGLWHLAAPGLGLIVALGLLAAQIRTFIWAGCPPVDVYAHPTFICSDWAGNAGEFWIRSLGANCFLCFGIGWHVKLRLGVGH